ncbi:MAG: hypothetical protein M3326_06445 [Actinomycetota bacterium]|nr:hypothetical protein [Actinomycetota bacterium]
MRTRKTASRTAAALLATLLLVVGFNPAPAHADIFGDAIGIVGSVLDVGKKTLDILNPNQSVVVEVQNNTSRTLTRVSDNHDHGGYAKTPQTRVEPGKSEVFGSQDLAGSVFTGTEGSVDYAVSKGGTVSIHWDNPAFGGNSCSASTSGDPTLSVVATCGSGNKDAHMRFEVFEAGQAQQQLVPAPAPAPAPPPAAPPLAPPVAKRPRPTALVAAPPRLPLWHLSARLTAADTGAPIAGQTVTMSSSAGRVCRGLTDAAGTAECAGLVAGVPAVAQIGRDRGYTASFAGTSSYAPSSARGSIADQPRPGQTPTTTASVTTTSAVPPRVAATPVPALTSPTTTVAPVRASVQAAPSSVVGGTTATPAPATGSRAAPSPPSTTATTSPVPNSTPRPSSTVTSTTAPAPVAGVNSGGLALGASDPVAPARRSPPLTAVFLLSMSAIVVLVPSVALVIVRGRSHDH